MTHSDFLAKTFVNQCKGYKRFRIEGMYYRSEEHTSELQSQN